MALNGWTSKCTITINKDLVSGDIAEAKIMLNALNVPAELLADAGGCKSDGSDIRFATDSAGNNLLDFDLQHIDKQQGEIIVHVKMNISSSVDTVIYLFWGNSSAQFPLSDVWNEFYGAIHFQEQTIGDGFKTAKDSAGTYNALSEKGTPLTVDGKVAGQKAWNCTLANFAILEEEMNISGDFYFEFLINFNGVAPTAGTQNIFSPVDYFSGVGTVGIGINYGALVVRDLSIGGAQWNDWSAWHHVAFYVEDGTGYYYLDGALHSSAAFSAKIERLKWLSGADTPARPVQYPNTDFSISSLRFTRTGPIQTPSDVIKTRWNNYNSIATFATSGPVEVVTILSTLTLTNLKDGTEVRIYDENDSMNELGGIEDSVGDFQLSFSGVKLVTVVLHHINYQYLRFTSITLDGNTSVPINQQPDPAYKNP